MMLVQLRKSLLALPRRQKVAIMVACDLVALPICLLAAFYLRLGDASLLQQHGLVAPVILALFTIPVFYLCGLYRNVVRFVEIPMLKSIGIGLALLIVATDFLTSLITESSLSRSGLLIYWFIAFAYVVVSRFGARSILRMTHGSQRPSRTRVAIFGAGEAGSRLCRSLRDSDMYEPVCFFDEDENLHDKQVGGLTVYSPASLHSFVRALDVQQIILAIPSLGAQARRRILESLKIAGVPVKTLPGLAATVEGRMVESTIRDIRLEDLLGRAPVMPCDDLFSRCIRGKAVLVTGAGGSIGSELCRQVLSQKPSTLVLLDHSEYALYAIEHELRAHAPTVSVTAYLGSVCDAGLLSQVMAAHRVDTIYHAAAYKHVPMVESNMSEGIRNNVRGTFTVAQAAARHQVETCVLISTDKAVRPTNVMGATKRCAEQIFQAFAAQPDHVTNFSMVRFGNVLGSSGSVVPLFREQIRCGGPVTLTHEEVTRYFMLIPEAAQLVIQAGAMSTGGDVFLLDMGESVRISDLARTMIQMSGLSEKTAARPDGDIEIQVVGLRPGEKLYEELLIGDEVLATDHLRIMCSHEQFLAWRDLRAPLDALFTACATGDCLQMQIALQALVPEYAPYSSLSLRPPRLARATVPDLAPRTAAAKPAHARELLGAFE